MKNSIILKGVKLKIYFKKKIRSLKLINEYEEKFFKKLKYEKKEISDPETILFLKKRVNNIFYKISLKEDHISIYVENVFESKIQEVLLEIKGCVDLFKEVLYNYNGENPGVNSVIFTKGYDTADLSITEYLKSIETPFRKNGVSIGIKYCDRMDINLLIITTLLDDEDLENFYDNIDEKVSLLYETNL